MSEQSFVSVCRFNKAAYENYEGLLRNITVETVRALSNEAKNPIQ
jgi:hypothetical protein